MLNTVIFDMDGLLIDSEPLWEQSMKEAFASLGIALGPQHYHQTTGLRTFEVVSYWKRQFQWSGKSTKDVSEDILQRVTDKILHGAKAMDGMEYILQFFEERSFKIGLASSSPMHLIRTILDYLNIRSYFQAVYSAEHEPYGKPHPAVYLTCARELGSEPEGCLAFEDSVNGMIAAKAARMKTVAVPEVHKRNDPRYALADLVLPSLREFDASSLLGLQA